MHTNQLKNLSHVSLSFIFVKTHFYASMCVYVCILEYFVKEVTSVKIGMYKTTRKKWVREIFMAHHAPVLPPPLFETFHEIKKRKKILRKFLHMLMQAFMCHLLSNFYFIFRLQLFLFLFTLFSLEHTCLPAGFAVFIVWIKKERKFSE